MAALRSSSSSKSQFQKGDMKVKSGKTFRYQGISESLVGSGAYGRVFTGHFKSSSYTSWEGGSDGVMAAIKRVEINFKSGLDIEKDREYVALKELRHPSIVTLYAVEDDDNFRNYVFELCEANLEDFITRKFAGPMPDEIEGLYQMASGLKFIHEKKMIHRDIKPENVLISLAGERACLKIADLGYTKPLNEDGIHYDLASGLKGTKYYMAPELLVLNNLHVLQEKCTISSDVFAAGCTFFRYLAGGLHPFGKGFDIQGNIVDGNPVNATAEKSGKTGGDKWKNDLIVKMIKLNPNERPSFSEILVELEHHLEARSTEPSFPSPLSGGGGPVIVVQNSSAAQTINVGEVQIDRSNRIGQGAFGQVYTGIFNGEKVAVKRVLDSVGDSSVDYCYRELKSYKHLLNHPNIVKLKHYEEDRDFKYFVMELCAGSLDDYIRGKYKGPMPTDEQVIFQLANGLEYIHSRNILHRDIQPGNILISLTKPVQMKYCDFGSSKSTNERGTCSLSGIRGAITWISPEEIRMLESRDISRGSVRSDVFSAGCVIIFFLLRGKHPFGDHTVMTHTITTNIMNGNPVNVNELPMDHFARPFVIKMIEHDPVKRISLSEVIDHLKPLQPSIRLSSCQYDNQNLLCSKGTFSLVYRVETFEGSPLAVKRVPTKNCSTKSFEELRQLKHSNIVHLLHFDRDNSYKYFEMEWCVASLDQLFLSEEDPKKYKNPIPSDEQFCFQLISALHYIHEEKNFIHGSIKPTNILISSSEVPQIKLSDCGLTSSHLNEGHTSTREITGFLSSCYWLAPELLDSDNGQNEPTKESDIFAAGSVFFYFLSKGCHLFGDEIHKIIKNTSNGIDENIFRKLSKSVFPSGLIRWMTSKAPGDRPKTEDINRHLNLIKSLPPPENLRKIGDIHFSIDHFLEGGGQGNVFVGKWKWNNSEVAVKRIGPIDTLTPDNKALVNRERENYKKLNHRNITKLLAFDEDNYFMYLALERCLTSLDDYCCKRQLYQGIIPMPSDHEVLLQMAQGLQYIHSEGLIHRDVKPGNILISYDNPAMIKWADFGMTRTVITGSKTFSWSKLQGTDRWLAPELIEANKEMKIKGSQKCDIFALGCVFFFFLVPGIHPFGDGVQYSIQNNIKNNARVNFDRLPMEHFARDIIIGMIENNRESRSKLPDVIQKLVDIGPNTETA